MSTLDRTGKEGDPIVEVATEAIAREARETAEIVELTLTVVGPVNYLGESAEKFKDMPLVGLDQYQREKLGLGEKDTGNGKMVEVVGADGKLIGNFIVVKGSAKLLNSHDSFCANGIKPGEQVKVRKPKIELGEDEYEVISLLEISGDEEKRTLRKHVILKELGLNPNEYMTVPTLLAKQLGITEKFVPYEVKVRVCGGGYTTLMAAILTKRDAVGFTTDAAKAIGLSNETLKIHMSVEDGVIVVG